MVFPRRRAIILVHGCFWHVHACQRGRVPKTNVGYWSQKRARNRLRDRRAVQTLRRRGWRVLTIWECHLKEKLSRRISDFFAK
jgi:DNA mismatch endonuclease, patch repair protein